MVATKVILAFTSVWEIILNPEMTSDDLLDFNNKLTSLRNSLLCCVCSQLLTNKEVLSPTTCKEHFVCRGCVGGNRAEEKKCIKCEEWSTFQSDISLDTMLQNYQEFCLYILKCEHVIHLLEEKHEKDPMFDTFKLIDLLGEGIKGYKLVRRKFKLRPSPLDESLNSSRQAVPIKLAKRKAKSNKTPMTPPTNIIVSGSGGVSNNSQTVVGNTFNSAAENKVASASSWNLPQSQPRKTQVQVVNNNTVTTASSLPTAAAAAATASKEPQLINKSQSSTPTTLTSSNSTGSPAKVHVIPTSAQSYFGSGKFVLVDSSSKTMSGIGGGIPTTIRVMASPGKNTVLPLTIPPEILSSMVRSSSPLYHITQPGAAGFKAYQPIRLSTSLNQLISPQIIASMPSHVLASGASNQAPASVTSSTSNQAPLATVASSASGISFQAPRAGTPNQTNAQVLTLGMPSQTQSRPQAFGKPIQTTLGAPSQVTTLRTISQASTPTTTSQVLASTVAASQTLTKSLAVTSATTPQGVTTQGLGTVTRPLALAATSQIASGNTTAAPTLVTSSSTIPPGTSAPTLALRTNQAVSGTSTQATTLSIPNQASGTTIQASTLAIGTTSQSLMTGAKTQTVILSSSGQALAPGTKIQVPASQSVTLGGTSQTITLVSGTASQISTAAGSSATTAAPRTTSGSGINTTNTDNPPLSSVSASLPNVRKRRIFVSGNLTPSEIRSGVWPDPYKILKLQSSEGIDCSQILPQTSTLVAGARLSNAGKVSQPPTSQPNTTTFINAGATTRSPGSPLVRPPAPSGVTQPIRQILSNKVTPITSQGQTMSGIPVIRAVVDTSNPSSCLIPGPPGRDTYFQVLTPSSGMASTPSSTTVMSISSGSSQCLVTNVGASGGSCSNNFSTGTSQAGTPSPSTLSNPSPRLKGRRTYNAISALNTGSTMGSVQLIPIRIGNQGTIQYMQVPLVFPSQSQSGGQFQNSNTPRIAFQTLSGSPMSMPVAFTHIHQPNLTPGPGAGPASTSTPPQNQVAIKVEDKNQPSTSVSGAVLESKKQ